MLEVFAYAGVGLIIGSFLNVLAVRRGSGESLGGRSKCVACSHTLSWRDLIPVLSWIVLLGKCRYCGMRISILYPLTEIATAVVFALIGLAHLPILPTILAFWIAGLLVAIARFDLTHMLIPNAWVYLFAALSLGAALYDRDALYLLSQILAGPIAALPFLALWFVSRGTWMGLGDAKLALGIGWLLGLQGGITSILVAFVVGAIVGLVLVFLSSQWGKSLFGDSAGFTMKSEVPFGPFLVVSCIFVWIMQIYGAPLPGVFL